MPEGHPIRKRNATLLYNPSGIRSQAEVARILGISRTRVYHIETRAFRKLLAGLQADKTLQKAYDDICTH